jgi:hypothetical protein
MPCFSTRIYKCSVNFTKTLGNWHPPDCFESIFHNPKFWTSLRPLNLSHVLPYTRIEFPHLSHNVFYHISSQIAMHGVVGA